MLVRFATLHWGKGKGRGIEEERRVIPRITSTFGGASAVYRPSLRFVYFRYFSRAFCAFCTIEVHVQGPRIFCTEHRVLVEIYLCCAELTFHKQGCIPHQHTIDSWKFSLIAYYPSDTRWNRENTYSSQKQHLVLAEYIAHVAFTLANEKNRQSEWLAFPQSGPKTVYRTSFSFSHFWFPCPFALFLW